MVIDGVELVIGPRSSFEVKVSGIEIEVWASVRQHRSYGWGPRVKIDFLFLADFDGFRPESK
jgi:hypothetical protein